MQCEPLKIQKAKIQKADKKQTFFSEHFYIIALKTSEHIDDKYPLCVALEAKTKNEPTKVPTFYRRMSKSRNRRLSLKHYPQCEHRRRSENTNRARR